LKLVKIDYFLVPIAVLRT